MLILDTDALIEIENKNLHAVKFLVALKESHPEDIAITSAVYAEFLFGTMQLSAGRREAAIAALNNYTVLDFDKPAAGKFAYTKWTLEKEGRVIPIFDLITAAIALRHGATVVTGDAHFERIPELLVVKMGR